MAELHVIHGDEHQKLALTFGVPLRSAREHVHSCGFAAPLPGRAEAQRCLGCDGMPVRAGYGWWCRFHIHFVRLSWDRVISEPTHLVQILWGSMGKFPFKGSGS